MKIRVNISVEKEDLEKIDSSAKELGLTRSEFLVMAALEKDLPKEEKPA